MIAVLEALAGIGVSLFFTLWDTTVQQQVPPRGDRARQRLRLGGGGRPDADRPRAVAARSPTRSAWRTTMRLGTVVGVARGARVPRGPGGPAVRRPPSPSPAYAAASAARSRAARARNTGTVPVDAADPARPGRRPVEVRRAARRGRRSVASTLPPRAIAVSRLARLTGRPYQSPPRVIAGPAAIPTRTCGNPWPSASASVRRGAASSRASGRARARRASPRRRSSSRAAPAGPRRSAASSVSRAATRSSCSGGSSSPSRVKPTRSAKPTATSRPAESRPRPSARPRRSRRRAPPRGSGRAGRSRCSSSISGCERAPPARRSARRAPPRPGSGRRRGRRRSR